MLLWEYSAPLPGTWRLLDYGSQVSQSLPLQRIGISFEVLMMWLKFFCVPKTSVVYYWISIGGLDHGCRIDSSHSHYSGRYVLGFNQYAWGQSLIRHITCWGHAFTSIPNASTAMVVQILKIVFRYTYCQVLRGQYRHIAKCLTASHWISQLIYRWHF